jgi:hypothetical protein
MRPRQRHLDFAALDAYLAGTGAPLSATELAQRLGHGRTVILRWRRDGTVPIYTADRIAIELGVHPVIIWQDFHHDEEMSCPT